MLGIHQTVNVTPDLGALIPLMIERVAHDEWGTSVTREVDEHQPRVSFGYLTCIEAATAREQELVMVTSVIV